MESETMTELWTTFYTSEEYEELKQYPDAVVHEVIQFVMVMMKAQRVTALTDWRIGHLQALLKGLVALTPDQPALWQIVRDGLQSFVHFLVRTNRIRISKSAFGELLTAFRDYQLPDKVADLWGGPAKWPFDQVFSAGRPMYAKGQAADLAAEAKDWQLAYRNSPDWQERPAGLSVEQLAKILPAFVNATYRDYRKSPRAWTQRVVTGVLTNYFVTELTLSLATYQLVAPTLCQVFAFAGKTGRLRQQLVPKYQKFVKKAAPQMLERVAILDGLAPVTVLKATLANAGVDLSTQGVMGAYLQSQAFEG